jgi:hypothetical protein
LQAPIQRMNSKKSEKLLIREQFGLRKGIKSEDIDKLMTFYIDKNFKCFAILGSKIRN